MNKAEKIKYLQLLDEKERRRKQNLCLEYFNMFYDWQMEFCADTLSYFECCLMCANQVGKTRVGTVIDAFHLTGTYPDGWPGHKFIQPPLVWCLGYSMEKTRDLLQTALFGKYDKQTGFEGGLVPKDKILRWEACIGIPNAMRTVKVKHVNGTSIVQFWSYSQGQHAIMGDVVDWFHIDEEPRDQTIRPQVLTRTINGDNGKGGRGIYTFTPENGSTDLVIQFRDTPSASQSFMKKGWIDAPHMTEEKRKRLLEQYPAHQRKMRSEGEPMLGHGRIYDIADDFIECKPFEIPKFWKTICGLDIGGMGINSHPQAIVKISHDLASDTIYLTNSWKAVGVSANDAWGATHKWAKGYPLAWPHDGLQQEKGRDDSIHVKNHYTNAGFKTLPTHAKWPDSVDGTGATVKGGISVESGVYDILDRATKGKFKVFKGQPEFFEEWRQYHRDDKGNIVKLKDDILSAVRYALMMLRYATYVGESAKPKVIMPRPIPIMGRR